MIFGRCFEKALSAYYCGEDSAAVLFKEWEAYRDEHLDFGKGGSWDKILHQGTNLLHKFAQEDRIRIFNPEKNLQLKLDHFQTVVSFSLISTPSERSTANAFSSIGKRPPVGTRKNPTVYWH
jgi:hypothetical protein